MPNGFGLRLRKLRDLKGFSIEELAHKAGMTKDHVGKLERGEQKNPRWDTVEALAKALGTHPNAILYDVAHEVTVRPSNAFDAPFYKPNDIPVVGMARAGRGGFFDDHGHPLESCTDMIHRPQDIKDPNAYAVRIEGDSMEPVLTKGSLVVCVTDREPRSHEWVVVQLKSDEIMVKELTQKDGMIVLKSLNPAHDPIVVSNKDVRAIHPVTWIKRK